MDRQEPRPAVPLPPRRAGRRDRRGRGVHDPARHDLRRELRRGRRRSSACAGGRRSDDPKAAAFIAECKAGGTSAAEIETAEKMGFETGDRGRPSARSRMAAAGLHREFRADGLWHRRDVRRSRSRPARLRICEAISSADQARRRGEHRRRVRADRRRGRNRAGRRGQLALPRRADDRAGRGRSHPPRRRRPAGARARSSIACATGACRASVTGARRSRSSIAPNAARCRCRATSCRSSCPRTSSFDMPGNPLDRHPTWKHVDCPSCGGDGDARDRHARHLRRFELVLHPLRQPAERQAVRPRRGREVAAGRAIYRRGRACDPAPALRALLDPGAAAARPARHRRAVQGPVHAGHGHPRDLPRRRRQLAQPRRGRARTATTGSTSKAAIRSRPGRVEKMSKSKRNTVDPEPILAKYGADAVRWFMLSDSPPERDLEWSEGGIEGASRFVQRVWRLRQQHAAADGEDDALRAQASPHHRRGRRGDRRTAVQQGGRAALRADQRDREGDAVGRPRPKRSARLLLLAAPMAPHLAEEAWARSARPG